MSMSGISLAADFDLAGLKSQSWAQLVIANDGMARTVPTWFILVVLAAESFEVASSGEAEGVEQGKPEGCAHPDHWVKLSALLLPHSRQAALHISSLSSKTIG